MNRDDEFRILTFAEAINEAQFQCMELDPNVYIMGQLVDYKSGVFGTTTGLVDQFGPERVRDYPVAEASMTSAAIGSAITGLRPIITHHRLDFMIYSLDAITNWLALWRLKSGGKNNVPIVIRAVVGKGWGQGPQHSKSLHSWFSNIPGLRVAIPSNAFDAKGLLIDSVFSNDPTIIIEHRSLFGTSEKVPIKPYRVKFGKASIVKKGKDITFVSYGVMTPFANKIANYFHSQNISIEVLDLRTLSPIDNKTILSSIKKTKRLCVFDPSWKSFGAASEIITLVCEKINNLKKSPLRISYPDSHTPSSKALEDLYYPNEIETIEKVKSHFYD